MGGHQLSRLYVLNLLLTTLHSLGQIPQEKIDQHAV